MSPLWSPSSLLLEMDAVSGGMRCSAFLGGWEEERKLDLSMPTAVLYATGGLACSKGNLSNELRENGLGDSFDLAYTDVAEEVLEFQVVSL